MPRGGTKAARRYKGRATALQTSAAELQGQLDTARGVKAENAELRATVDALHRKYSELQGVVGALSERASTDVDSGAALLLRNRALERQVVYLREEVNKQGQGSHVLHAEMDMLRQQVADRNEEGYESPSPESPWMNLPPQSLNLPRP